MRDKTEFQMKLSPAAELVSNMLEKAGFDCYAVGGCVRDAMLMKAPQDFDLASSAEPEEMKRVFGSLKTVDTGIRHGTVTVIAYGTPVEVTAFREDGDYSDNRRPDSVRFTRSLDTDLARRDFTVNAMAWSKKTGLCDPFGGARDLERGIIRCVGLPDRRFSEDALRILRGLRFASALGFEIEPQTARSIRENRTRLKNISGERIFSELKKLLCGRAAERILLEFSDVMTAVIPELSECVGFDQKSRYHCYDVYEHIVKTVGACECDPTVRLAALFHDISKPECFVSDAEGHGHFPNHPERSSEKAELILRRFHADTKTVETVKRLIKYHDSPLPNKPSAVKRMLSVMPEGEFFMLLGLKKADLSTHAPEYRDGAKEYDAIRQTAEDIIERGECFSVGGLAVGGKDIMEALSIPPGEEIGRLLSELLCDVIDGRIKNERTELIKRAEMLHARESGLG